jgi:tRNA nucleotidyltransferase (CCA-adding enzyme)
VADATWEHFPHGADVGIRGRGRTLAEAFAQAGRALTGTICDVARVRPQDGIDIACQAPAPDLLFLDWINALVYEMATRRMLFGAFDVWTDGASLRARARGEPVDRARHQPAVEVKGATVTGLRVAQEPDGRWVAQCVVDV